MNTNTPTHPPLPEGANMASIQGPQGSEYRLLSRDYEPGCAMFSPEQMHTYLDTDRAQRADVITLEAIADEFRKAIPTMEGRVLAAMIAEGVTALVSHIQAAMQSRPSADAMRMAHAPVPQARGASSAASGGAAKVPNCGKCDDRELCISGGGCFIQAAASESLELGAARPAVAPAQDAALSQRLVPTEPTPQMRKAAVDAWLNCGDKLLLNKAAAAVRAGIAAAPPVKEPK